MTPQRQQSRLGAMTAQLDGAPKSPRSINSTVEQLMRGETSKASPHTLSAFAREHDMEDDHAPPKKSVLAKVKEKARKWRNTLSKKKNNEDSNATPSWGVSLEDDEDEDPEYLGAPMYESEMAPEGYKETTKQQPRAVSVTPERNVMQSNPNSEAGKKREAERNSGVGQNKSRNEKRSSNSEQLVDRSMIKNHGAENPTKTVTEPAIKTHDAEKPTQTPTEDETEKPTKTLAEAVTEKLAPAYATVSDATQALASKIQSLAISTIQTPPPVSVNKAERSPGAAGHKGSASLATKEEAPGSAPASLDRILRDKGRAAEDHPSTSEQMWDRGVSVKEYIMHKLEPGDDEKALSQVISEAISPRKTLGQVAVVEKFKEAVNSLLRNQEPSNDSKRSVNEEPSNNSKRFVNEEPSYDSKRFVYHTAQNSLSQFTSSHEVVEEENHGRMLQAN